MLPKEFRLKSSKTIGDVFKNGKFSSSGFLFIKFKRNEKDNPRFAFSVGLKFSKIAAKRNRAKRILREAMRPLVEKIQSDVDVVVCFKNVKIEEKDLTTELTRKLLKDALQRARLI